MSSHSAHAVFATPTGPPDDREDRGPGLGRGRETLARRSPHFFAIPLVFAESLPFSGSLGCSSSTVLPGFNTLPARPGYSGAYL